MVSLDWIGSSLGSLRFGWIKAVGGCGGEVGGGRRGQGRSCRVVGWLKLLFKVGRMAGGWWWKKLPGICSDGGGGWWRVGWCRKWTRCRVNINEVWYEVVICFYCRQWITIVRLQQNPRKSLQYSSDPLISIHSKDVYCSVVIFNVT